MIWNKIIKSCFKVNGYISMSRDMWFPIMWHFDMIDSDKPVQHPVKLRNSKCYSLSNLTVIEYSSDQQML